jgi:hypothetical protein
MPAPLESNFLVPNVTFFIELFLMLVVLGPLLGGLVWFLTRRRGTTSGR